VALFLLLLALLIGGFGLSFGTGTGSTGSDALQSQVAAAIPSWAARQGHSGNARFLAGARLFAETGCTNCHMYLGKGSTNLGAPDLSAEGTKNHSVSYLVAKLRCPSCVTPASSMPGFAALGTANLRKIAVFLEASKRGR
jgi:cbb3-type cytochrome oxidase cytochrome c subunit